MKKEVIEIVAKTGEALKDIKELFSTMVDAEKEAQKQTDKTIEGVKDIGKSSKATEKEVGGIAKGFRGVGLAIKAAGIGLLIGVMNSLKDIFSQNQRVVDLFSTAFETFSIVVNQVVTALIDTYDAIAKSSENFDALGKVVKGLLTLAITPLKLAFFGIKLGVQQAQLAWEQSFFGGNDKEKIAELTVGILETKLALVEVGEKAIEAGGNIVSNFGEAVGEIGNIATVASEKISKVSIKAAFETAKTNIELKKSAEIAAAQQSLLIERYDLAAEKQRQIRDDERNSIEDRKKANDELNLVLDKQEIAMTKQANLQIAAAAAADKLNSTTETQVALIEAQANAEGVLAQVAGFRSEQQANDLALSKEQIELNKAIGESESLLSIERKRFDAEQIINKLSQLEKLKEVDALEQEQEQIRLQNLIDNTNAGTQAKIDAQIVLDEFNEQSRQTNIERNREIAAEEIAMSKQKIKDKGMVVDAISQFADAESGVGKALLIVKQGLALQETIMDLKRITFKGIEAVGSAGVSTAQNVAESSKIGFPWNIVTIAGAIAQGVGIISSVKSAVSKTKAKAGGASASVPQIPQASAQAQAPQFNVVGTSGTNQLASAIGEQTQEPVKAYVVGNDITTQQELDRNIVDSATFG